MKQLQGTLPQPPGEYKASYMQELIRKLQQAFSRGVHTEDDAAETEAINYFLSN